MYEFKSSHSSLIERYILFKRNLGYKFEYESTFSQFDRFLCDNNVKELGLSREICDKWEEKRPLETDANRYQRIGLIRNFAIYILGLGYKTCTPEHNFRFNTTFTPHIYTKEELLTIFNSLDLNINSKISPAYPALFRTMYGCGLRLHEVIALKIRDVDILGKTITITHSKNGQTRKLPISESLFKALLEYKSEHRCNANAEDFFFVTRHKDKIHKNSVYSHFRTMLRKSGIPHKGKGTGPRLHDFRYPNLNKIQTFIHKAII